jgi:thioredoxin reductase
MAQLDKIYNVAVVGAGPAGSSLAFWLAQAGLKVILTKKGGGQIFILDIVMTRTSN